MKIGSIRNQNDSRVAITPETVKKMLNLGVTTVYVEAQISEIFSDDDYQISGATVVQHEEVLQQSDILISVANLNPNDLVHLKPDTLLISFLDVFQNPDYIELLIEMRLSAISLEMIPRTTLAQKMDALSSQTSLAGYRAVIEGSYHMNKVFPMMMTPSGTIKPAKVFVIGAGVAGLQALATAKRLGANVIAFDTRPAVKEQVESLGGKFLQIDLGKTTETKAGYAVTLTNEQLQKQQQEMIKVVQDSDLVITTAKLFGKKAPIIIKENVLRGMKKGSVIVDLAAGTGGNVEGTKVDEVVQKHGVTLIGYKDIATKINKDASIMLSNNIFNLLTHFWNTEIHEFEYRDDEILNSCLITKEGHLLNKKVKEVIGG